MTGSREAEYLTSPLLEAAGFRHAFFTRRGGVSDGAYHSLNFSLAVGDSEDNVRENLARAARALGVAPEHVYFLSQVHGAAVHRVEAGTDRRALLALEGDALLAREGSLASGVRSADCVPILLADEPSGAVGAVHAGWRGMVRGVIEAAVAALREMIGGQGRILAAIGPHISADAFEVSDDVASELAAAAKGVRVSEKRGRKSHVDLRLLGRTKLVGLGLEERHVDDVRGCTLSDRERFFSYRRDGARSGRHLSAIVPRS